jgi:cysteine synthase
MVIRQEIKNLEKIIGNTKLEKYDGKLPNNNKLFIKRECDNPFGSHYDRVYLALFKYYETKGIIKPGDKVFETSSGTAGASFAGIAKALGYKPYLAIPKGVDDAVIKVIKSYGTKIYFTPEKDYVSGFPVFLKIFKPWTKGLFFLNHSMGRKTDKGYADNKITLNALGNIIKEVKNKINIDYYVPATGNGSSILGPCMNLDKKTKCIVFESVQSGVAFDLLYPGKYKKLFGIVPGILPKHHLRGTSYQGINFPHIKHTVEKKIIKDVILVSDKEVDLNYKKLTGKNTLDKLSHWDSIKSEFGRSTRAGIVTVKEIAKTVKKKNFVIIAYDKANRYDY